MAQGEFRSTIYYHNNNPGYVDSIRLSVPTELVSPVSPLLFFSIQIDVYLRLLLFFHFQFERCHLFFTFWHVSSSSDKNSPFGFSYLPLTVDDGVQMFPAWKKFFLQKKNKYVLLPLLSIPNSIVLLFCRVFISSLHHKKNNFQFKKKKNNFQPKFFFLSEI